MSLAVNDDIVGLGIPIGVEEATNDLVSAVYTVEDPLTRLRAMAVLLEEWKGAGKTLLDVRREMVEDLDPYLSYRLMAEALGCSKANIHQILHPKES